ncbi:MAG: HEPN domain-containing protein [Endomicrobia bacterium]|nr:HEPN domain-containing protein [Endomicrobiia bacterium]MDW8056526.1 HEPN domain-containing protein [Elusimicrobiota bacterium]
MKDKILKLINKAENNIKISEKLLKDGYLDVAISRLYYSMFYIAEALLLSKQLSFSSHKGVIVNFAKEFVKTGIFDEKFHNVLKNAFEDRQDADYEFVEFTIDEIKDYIKSAKEFLKSAKEYLKIK